MDVFGWFCELEYNPGFSRGLFFDKDFSVIYNYITYF